MKRFRFDVGEIVLMNRQPWRIRARVMRRGEEFYELEEMPGEFAEHLFQVVAKGLPR